MRTIKHPPSIISIDHTICIGKYSAYVYKYTNTTNGKWYVGYHIGQFDGSYWHSSQNDEFKKRYQTELQSKIVDLQFKRSELEKELKRVNDVLFSLGREMERNLVYDHLYN